MSVASSKWWKRTGMMLALIGFAGIFWTLAIWSSYLNSLPRTPVAATGKIFPLNIHGVVVFQTREEQQRLDLVQYSSIAIIAVSFMMSLMAGSRRGRSEE